MSRTTVHRKNRLTSNRDCNIGTCGRNDRIESNRNVHCSFNNIEWLRFCIGSVTSRIEKRMCVNMRKEQMRITHVVKLVQQTRA